MTHEPPLPEDTVSPDPLDAEAQAATQAKKEVLVTSSAADKPRAEPANRGKWIGLAAAGGAIGSAAIAAALLYHNRPGKNGSPRGKAATKPKPKRNHRRGDPSPANED